MKDGVAVQMDDGSTYIVRKLLSKGDSNVKLSKSDKSGKGYLTYGLSLSPAATSGHNVCPNATPGCKAGCLYYAGLASVFPKVNVGRIAKTKLFFQNRQAFKEMLLADLLSAKKRAAKLGKQLAVRLNVLSDIAWEKIFPEIFTLFHDVQFYDYTKVPLRAYKFNKGDFPKNYHLTFSRSEVNADEILHFAQVNSIVNIAVVFDKKLLPKFYLGRDVVSGDETDLRFLDKSGIIVGLYAKGKARKDTSGFVVPTKEVRVSLPLI